MDFFGLLITAAIVGPLLIPILLASFYVNYRSIILLRKVKQVPIPATVRRGNRKLFVIK